jgi:hypothetical protein
VFFSNGAVQENPPKKFVRANENNKRDAVKFINGVKPAGTGSAIPALAAAFKAVESADGVPVIYLLTTGQFGKECTYEGPDGEKLAGADAVSAWLRDHNKDVRVCPIIIAPTQPDEKTTQAMQVIAKENGGEVRTIKTATTTTSATSAPTSGSPLTPAAQPASSQPT